MRAKSLMEKAEAVPLQFTLELEGQRGRGSMNE